MGQVHGEDLSMKQKLKIVLRRGKEEARIGQLDAGQMEIMVKERM